jgi:hypothetical protein
LQAYLLEKNAENIEEIMFSHGNEALWEKGFSLIENVLYDNE